METKIDLAEFAAATGQLLPTVVKEMLSFNHHFGSVGRKRTWKSARLRERGRDCPLCDGEMRDVDDMAMDHDWTIMEAAEAALSGDATLAEAHVRLWSEGNLRVVHSKCNYGRNRA